MVENKKPLSKISEVEKILIEKVLEENDYLQKKAWSEEYYEDKRTRR